MSSPFAAFTSPQPKTALGVKNYWLKEWITFRFSGSGKPSAGTGC
jgi:hypothetical protein